MSLLLLLPKKSTYPTFDCLVNNRDLKSLKEAFVNLSDWLQIVSIDAKKRDKVCHCVEELMINDAEFSSNKGHFDIHIAIMENKIFASLKDTGKPFDPTACPEKDFGIGLKIVKAMCPHFEYKYMYGQNVTFLTWDVD